ncbi:MAG: Rieske 2Fe-2S domain-containing protein [Bacillota bacterium]
MEPSPWRIHNQCPHLGCALHKGKMKGYYLECPCHDWLFDVRTGEFEAAPEITVPTYEVKIEEGKVYVKV